MKYVALLSLTLIVGNLYELPVHAQSPPEAIPLERRIKSADVVFVGRLVSARAAKGQIYYGLLVERNIIGTVDVRCLTSNFPYKIGVAYVFFVSNIKSGCALAGDFLPSGLEVTSLRSAQYVKMSESRFLYPNFEEEFFSLSSIPIGGKNPITLWTGIELSEFEIFVRKLHRGKKMAEKPESE